VGVRRALPWATICGETGIDWISPQRRDFDPGPLHVRFVVDRVAGIGTGFSPCNVFSHCHYLCTCATYSSSCCFCHKDKRPTSVNFQMKQRSTGNRGLWKEMCIVDCTGDSGDSNNGFLMASASTSLLLRSNVLHVRKGRDSDPHCAVFFFYLTKVQVIGSLS
jgi:hypothetical protein